MVMAIWNAVGPLLGVVIGALLGPWVTWRWQRKQWLWDNKKQEYRDLLDALGSCVQEVKALKEWVYLPSRRVFGGTDLMEEERLKANEASSINHQLVNALRAASRVLEDRLFIDSALKANNVKSRWAELERIAMLRSVSSSSSATEKPYFDSAAFSIAWEGLATDLRRIAKEDVEESITV